MSFRAKGQRDDRRRRTSSDSSDSSSTVSTIKISSSSTNPVPRYTDAALRENQPHLTDLIPLRIVTCLGWFGFLLTFATLIHCLNYFGDAWFAGTTTQTFQLSGTGTLADWFNSLMLTLAASVMLVIYLVRRHKVNDYKGRYRIWLAAAIGCLITSVAVVTDIHLFLTQIMNQVVDFDTTLGAMLPQGVIWWLGPTVLIGGYISLRLLLDINESKLSVFMFLVSATLIVMATAIDRQWFTTWGFTTWGFTTWGFTTWGLTTWLPAMLDAQYKILLSSGLMMSSIIMLLMTCMFHARFTLLDAHGLIEVKTKVKQKKAKKVKQTKTSPNIIETEKTTTPPNTIEKQRKKREAIGSSTLNQSSNHSTTTTTKTSNQQKVDSQYSEEITTLQAKAELSKAERRRLKKLLRRQIAA